MKKFRFALAALAAVSVASVGAQAAENPTEAVTEASSETAGNSGMVASKDEMVTPEDVVEDDMVPIPGTSVKDGVYEDVTVDSSSSMFKITACTLTVEDGEMKAVLTMSSDGYLMLFMGTGEEAAAAPEEKCIPSVENEEGEITFEVPVEALDQGLDCAAYSKRKEKWYDRVILFRADSLPQDAFTEGVITTLEDLALEDGIYQADVVLEGGSGKTSVESPAVMTVKDGKATATIIFSSPNYDYVICGEEKFLPVSEPGENSAFELPVTGFDWKMPIAADTIAMSTPHEIEYTLTFDSAAIEKVEE